MESNCFFPPSRVICERKQGFSQKVVHVWKPAECNQPSPVDGSFKLRIGAVFSVCCNKITSNFYFFNKNVLEVKQKKNLIIKLTLQVERFPILLDIFHISMWEGADR